MQRLRDRLESKTAADVALSHFAQLAFPDTNKRSATTDLEPRLYDEQYYEDLKPTIEHLLTE